MVWFRLNGLGSSQNSQNNLIHNWCNGGCRVMIAIKPHVFYHTFSFVKGRCFENCSRVLHYFHRFAYQNANLPFFPFTKNKSAKIPKVEVCNPLTIFLTFKLELQIGRKLLIVTHLNQLNCIAN